MVPLMTEEIYLDVPTQSITNCAYIVEILQTRMAGRHRQQRVRRPEAAPHLPLSQIFSAAYCSPYHNQ